MAFTLAALTLITESK